METMESKTVELCEVKPGGTEKKMFHLEPAKGEASFPSNVPGFLPRGPDL